LIIAPNTRAHKVSIPAIDGEGIIEYSIDNLPLLKGLYVVSAGIFNFIDGNYIALDYQDKNTILRYLIIQLKNMD